MLGVDECAYRARQLEEQAGAGERGACAPGQCWVQAKRIIFNKMTAVLLSYIKYTLPFGLQNYEVQPQPPFL